MKEKEEGSWPLHIEIVRIKPQVVYNENREMAYEYYYTFVCLTLLDKKAHFTKILIICVHESRYARFDLLILFLGNWFLLWEDAMFVFIGLEYIRIEPSI